MVFYLRRQNFVQAESCLDSYVNCDGLDKTKIFLQVCFYLNRNAIKQAEKLVQKHLNNDRTSMIDNMLMSFIQEHYYKKQKIGTKYFRVARRKMFENYFHSKNNTQNNLNTNTLNEDDFDIEVWKELVIQLLKFNFADLAKALLPKIAGKPIFFNIVEANILLIQCQYAKSNKTLDDIIFKMEKTGESANQLADLILTKAGNCYFLQQYYEAEILFLKYFKLVTPKKDLFEVFLVLGQCYLERHSFVEAEEMFLKLTKIRTKSAVAWTGLGVAALHLRKLERSEEALFFASKLESLDDEIIVQLLILLLKKNGGSEAETEGIKKVWSLLGSFDIDDSLKIQKFIRILKQDTSVISDAECKVFIEKLKTK